MADDLRPVPRHVAIILDGNGRRATGRGPPPPPRHAARGPGPFAAVHRAIALGVDERAGSVFSP